MRKATKFHEQAIVFAEQADLARQANDYATARHLYFKAFKLERDAALLFLRKYDIEPTRSVLFRSAASLALDCGEFREAERMICHGLAACPPPEIRAELRELYEQMHFQLFLKDAGLHLADQQIVVSIWGVGIAPDFVPLREVIQRLNRAERLIYRTAERKTGLPFSDQSDAPKQIREQFPVYQRMQMAASYAVILQVGQSDRQLPLPFAIGAADIVSDVIDCIAFYNSDNQSELQLRISDSAYRRNFVSIVNTLYPRTPGISGVGIAGMASDGTIKSVNLVKRPRLRNAIPSDRGDDDCQSVSIEIAGVLYSAKSTSRIKRVEIKADDGREYRIDVPEGMLADVVRPHFDARVVAEIVIVEDGSLKLVDIRAYDDQAPNNVT